MTFKVMPEVQLRVDSAYPGDQGGGKARLDPETMLLLKISPGDLVAVEGKRRTVAKVWRSLVEDWNQRKIRIDNFTRLNAGVSIGDTVRVVKIDNEVEAKRVVLAPPEDLPKKIPIANNPHVVNGLIDFPIAKNDSVPIMLGLPFIQPQIVAFKVVEIEPEEAVIITKNTSVEFSDKPAAGFEGIKRFSYEDIGGLKDEMRRLRETIELPFRHPELFRKLGIEPPKGLLLHGPPGTGKTLIAKAVASESGAHFIPIAGPEIISKYYGESEQRLREVFEEARENAPSIIFIDELDSIAPRREDVTGEVERRVVAQLLTMMDGLEERGQVVVIGATNRVDAIDAALRRPGRFDREIEIGVPAESDRFEILKIHTKGMPLADEVSLMDISKQTHGFVGADLAALAREAAIRAMRRYIPTMDIGEDEIPEEVLDTFKVTAADFRGAQREVTPSAMREVLLEVSNVKWTDVGGLNKAIQEVKEAVEYPLSKSHIFEELDIKTPRGVLLYGPPGTGKTLIAKAVASESGVNFIAIRGPQIISKYYGESERAVRDIFKKARQVAPSIIFFDEIDALAPSRGSHGDSHYIESVLNQILAEMDGLEELKDVVVLGATNRPDILDPALLRAGRFDRLVYIGEPTLDDRKRILEIHSRFMPIEGEISGIQKLVDITEGLIEDDFDTLFREFNQTISKGALKTVTGDQFVEVQKKTHLEGFKREQRKNKIKENLNKIWLDHSVHFNSDVIEKITDATEGLIELDIELLCKEASRLSTTEAGKFNYDDIIGFIKKVSLHGLSLNDRRSRIKELLEQYGINHTDSAIQNIVEEAPELTDGYTENDLIILGRKVGDIALKEGHGKITLDHFKIAIQNTKYSGLAIKSIEEKVEEILQKYSLDTSRLEFNKQLKDFVDLLDGAIQTDIEKLDDTISKYVYKKGAGDLLIPQFERAQQRLNFSGLRIAQRRRKIKQLFNQYELYFSDKSREALISFIAEKTEGHVGSDLQALCREAGMLALRDGSTKVTKNHFEAAYEKVHPTMNERVRDYYGKIQQGFKGGLPTQVQPPEYQ
jgi:transitional endoplasmic reticulum ATPase